jgi:hypothetical protein
MVERNTSNAAMPGIIVLPGSESPSRANGPRWKLRDPASDQRSCKPVRIGKVRSRSR